MRSLIRLAMVFMLTAASPAFAETVLVPGSLRGFGSAGPSGPHRLCSPLAVGLYTWQVEWIVRLTRPNLDQGARLHELAAASERARDVIAAACHDDRTTTTTEQFDLMEQRAAALVQALRIVRPSYESFYGSLDAGQRAHIDALRTLH